MRMRRKRRRRRKKRRMSLEDEWEGAAVAAVTNLNKHIGYA